MYSGPYANASVVKTSYLTLKTSVLNEQPEVNGICSHYWLGSVRTGNSALLWAMENFQKRGAWRLLPWSYHRNIQSNWFKCIHIFLIVLSFMKNGLWILLFLLLLLFLDGLFQFCDHLIIKDASRSFMIFFFSKIIAKENGLLVCFCWVFFLQYLVT